MLNSTAINQNFKPERFHIVKYGSVVADTIHSRVFYLKGLNMIYTRKRSLLCECECGDYAKPGNRFINGHNMKGKNWKFRKIQQPPDSEAPFCECGCSRKTKWNKKKRDWNNFLSGHQNKGKDKYANEKAKEAPICGCGQCGQKTKWCKIKKRYNKYIRGHNHSPMKGKKCPEHSKRISGKNHPFYGLIGEENPNYGRKSSKEFCKAQSERMIGNQYTKNFKHSDEFCEKIRQRMFNGQAIYMISCNQNPSKPQVELFKLVKLIYPNEAVLNYPSLNKSIDIAIPNKMIAIEYDGSYWHQDKEADDKRQKELEDIGWKFLRYIDYVPSINELKKDLKKIEYRRSSQSNSKN